MRTSKGPGAQPGLPAAGAGVGLGSRRWGWGSLILTGEGRRGGPGIPGAEERDEVREHEGHRVHPGLERLLGKLGSICSRRQLDGTRKFMTVRPLRD